VPLASGGRTVSRSSSHHHDLPPSPPSAAPAAAATAAATATAAAGLLPSHLPCTTMTTTPSPRRGLAPPPGPRREGARGSWVPPLAGTGRTASKSSSHRNEPPYFVPNLLTTGRTASRSSSHAHDDPLGPIPPPRPQPRRTLQGFLPRSTLTGVPGAGAPGLRPRSRTGLEGAAPLDRPTTAPGHAGYTHGGVCPWRCTSGGAPTRGRGTARRRAGARAGVPGAPLPAPPPPGSQGHTAASQPRAHRPVPQHGQGHTAHPLSQGPPGHSSIAGAPAAAGGGALREPLVGAAVSGAPQGSGRRGGGAVKKGAEWRRCALGRPRGASLPAGPRFLRLSAAAVAAQAAAAVSAGEGRALVSNTGTGTGTGTAAAGGAGGGASAGSGYTWGGSAATAGNSTPSAPSATTDGAPLDARVPA